MRRLNAFIAGACLVGVLASSHTRWWFDLMMVVFGATNGMNALWGPRGDEA